jgi:class 3 adenylate cyclase/tetratricopeptide (TPR) repeat protein
MDFNSQSTPSSNLAAYLPQFYVRLIESVRQKPTSPFTQRITAAILLVDISGFTELTQQFAASGAIGAEDLSKLLNAYFGRMSDIITRHHGDIVAFAGDAALSMWPADGEGELAISTRRAVRAAREIQTELSNYQSPQNVVLRQRSAVSAGELTSMDIGGANGRWHFLLAGEAIAQAGEANGTANSGEILLSPAVWKVMQPHAKGVILSSGFARLEELSPALPEDANSAPPSDEVIADLSAYVHPVLADRLNAGQASWLAEFRNITALFIQLTNIDLSQSDAPERLHAAVGKTQDALFRYEGSEYQFLTDDKGLVLIGVFGLPPLAHEDDPERGVHAALAIRGELERLGIVASIGITSGSAFCGVLGNEKRRQYTAVGSVMNLSARLMQASGGGILCDESTARACKGRTGLRFESRGEIKLKGRTDAVAVYVPATSVATSESGLVGRETERTTLMRALEQLVHEKQGTTVVVEGEPGIGKSRLIEYFLEKVRALNVPCLVGAGEGIERSSSYYAWRRVFASLLRFDPQTGSPDSLRKRLAHRFLAMPQFSELTPLLSAVLPLELPDTEITAQMSSKVRAENTQHLLLQLLQNAASSSPLVLVLEDAHWLDSSSWALAALVSRVPGLLLVLSTRPIPDPVPAEYEELLSAAGERRLRLEALPADGTREIARRRLGVESLPDAVAGFLERRAGGHPYFIQELVSALGDAGLIKVENGKCIVGSQLGGSVASFEEAFGVLHIPNTIQGIITSRTDRLPAPQQLTLKVASVIGRSFALFLLRDIYPVESGKTEIPSYVKGLEKLDLMRPLPTPEPSEEFKHALTQEVVYISVSFAHRHALHRAIAEWYEKRYGEDCAPFYALLAHHYHHAEVMPKAIEYSAKAGEQALKRFANREAVQFFSDALDWDAYKSHPDAAPSTPVSDMDRAQWRLWLGQAFVHLSNYSEGRTNLEQGLSLLGEPALKSPVRVSGILLGQLIRQIVHRLWPNRFVGKNSGNSKLLEAARAYQGLMEIYYVENSPLNTLAAAMKSLNVAELAGPSPELARAYGSLGAIMGFIPWHKSAEAYCRRALETAEKVGDLSALSWASLCRGIYESGLGEWRQAEDLFRNVEQISTRLGDERNLGDGMQCRAMVNFFRGDFVQSLHLAESLYDSSARSKEPRLKAEALRWKAGNLIVLNRLENLPACLEEFQGLRAREKNGGFCLLADVYALFAGMHLHRGEYLQAFEAVESAAERIARISSSGHELLFERSAIAQVYLNLWEEAARGGLKGLRGQAAPDEEFIAKCRAGAAKACKGLRSFSRVFPIGRPALFLWSGLHSQLSGDTAKAVAAWSKSVAFAKVLNMTYDEGLAELEIGRHLPAGDPDRSARLERAAQMFERAGAAYDLSRAQRL